MSDPKLKKAALDYHTQGKPGKIEVIPTKPTQTKRDLSLAYSPGVAEPCLEIAQNIEDVYTYTAKGNLVAVISNGTAVLGLGDIGPEASKPVMEGKGILFKIFAGIDCFDLELNVKDPEDFIRVVKALEPTFGGINLEDIKAPECFEIEQRLKEELKIPIMHDDQHGTAIISGAALLNAIKLVKKDASQVKLVVNGAGASAISCTRLFIKLGIKKENVLMLDSKGVIHEGRDDIDATKKEFMTSRPERTLSEAINRADVFIGLSKANVLTSEMILSMAENPIVFAMANPDPEIAYDLAIGTRPDLIMATGRSDHPNQVNNVLGFPFIFRGALDVRATCINEEMKLAAVRALSELAHQPVPEIVNIAYHQKNLTFGKDYIIPKPLDPRLITTVAPAVAKAAMDSGVARKPITDWNAYHNELLNRVGQDNKFVRLLVQRAKADPKKVIFAEADTYKILKAAEIVQDEGIAIPVLLGNRDKINKIIAENHLDLEHAEIIDPMLEEEAREEYSQQYFHERQRKGVTLYDARKLMRERNYFGSMMLKHQKGDALISGLTRNYPNTIRPSLHIIGPSKTVNKVAGMYIMLTSRGPLFFADTTVNKRPSDKDLADIAILTADAVTNLNIKPRIAMLSYSNFGSVEGDTPTRVQSARDMVIDRRPDLVIDGDIQANFALNQKLLAENFPFSALMEGPANVFIFPSLSAGNICYKMIQELGSVEAIGPVLLGMDKPVHILQLGSSVREIVNMVTLAVLDAQTKMNRKYKLE